MTDAETPLWRCRNCQRTYGADWLHPACRVCGGPLDRIRPIRFDPNGERDEAPGIWRYGASFALPHLPPLSLGEGRTPLQPVQGRGRQVYVKREDANPSGSVKDRAAALLFAWARARQVDRVLTLGTPNTLRAWRLYGRAAKTRLRALAPATEPWAHSRRGGVHLFPGPIWETMTALHREAHPVLTPYHPLALDAYATIAYEVVAQLGRAPGTVVAPVGQGGLLLGIGRGFVALLQAGVIQTMPMLVGVEPLARAGMWALSRGGRETHLWVREEAPVPTPEAGRRFPWWGDLLLQLVAWSQGHFVAVDEEDWSRSRDIFLRTGLYLQPETALVWAAWAVQGRAWPEPVVLVLTGGVRTPLQRWRVRWRVWKARRLSGWDKGLL